MKFIIGAFKVIGGMYSVTWTAIAADMLIELLRASPYHGAIFMVLTTIVGLGIFAYLGLGFLVFFWGIRDLVKWANHQ
jgi:Na+(H+)/acetate symporter ActP